MSFKETSYVYLSTVWFHRLTHFEKGQLYEEEKTISGFGPSALATKTIRIYIWMWMKPPNRTTSKQLNMMMWMTTSKQTTDAGTRRQKKVCIMTTVVKGIYILFNGMLKGFKMDAQRMLRVVLLPVVFFTKRLWREYEGMLRLLQVFCPPSSPRPHPPPHPVRHTCKICWPKTRSVWTEYSKTR